MNQQDKKQAAEPAAGKATAGEAGPASEKTAGAAQQKAPAPPAGEQPAAEEQPAGQPPEEAKEQPPEEGKEPAPEHTDKQPADGKEDALPALREQLAAAQSQAAEARDRLLRTAAEYDNFRRRSAREQDAAFNNGVSFAVGQILGILDTLEMAAHAETADENYKKGVLMTLDKAAAALSALKVEEIPAEGQPFDPNLHAAVGQAPATDEAPSGQVVQVYQKGYRIGEKVIRHAAVVVAE